MAPLESHAEFTPDGSRDPVGLLLEQARTQVPELEPVRHGRVLVSPFTFYRGAALPMAADLATTPYLSGHPARVSHRTGWTVYLKSGDARPPGRRNARGQSGIRQRPEQAAASHGD